MPQKILLITPPFTQLNTPYPATAYIKGYLNTQDVAADQIDLGLDTILALFSREGFERLFGELSTEDLQEASENAQRIHALRATYIDTIDPIIQFLQDQDPTLAHLICERNFLPEAGKFAQLEDLEWAFGTMGIRDQARHIATMYLEDVSDYIVELIDPHFGFSRYAERLSMSATTFEELHQELQEPESFISTMMLELLAKQIEQSAPTLLCISVPFPGNLFAALKCGQWIKANFPKLSICMGGGYPNTELRSLTDARVFEFVDFITLDDGETPLRNLLDYLDNKIPPQMLKRTFMLEDGKVIYQNGSLFSDVKQAVVGTPDYSGLSLKRYLSVIQLTNPMHRLWSDGRWNKLTMAHGCYWGKCTFCDISLSYIKDYEASSATLIVDRMEELVAQTGERGFHFVDEAAPPALMKAVALEILSRRLVVSWWTNIRFEKSFTADLCRLLAASGCIAVSGGLEVASDRLLELIAKGVTIKQVAQVNRNFNQAGVMVHAYLMYGFPTQTDQETVDSLEVVRQMFEQGVMQSAFWHRFAMTAHSPVGLEPATFEVKNHTGVGTFANNDLVHTDPTGADHDLYSEGLKTSLYNFMHASCIDHDLQNWFDHKIPQTSLPPDLIYNHLLESAVAIAKPNQKVVWLGGPVTFNADTKRLKITTKQSDHVVKCKDIKAGKWLIEMLVQLSPKPGMPVLTYKELEEKFKGAGLEDFGMFWYGKVCDSLREVGLVIV
ncbi:MAG: radical SAM protein [Saprospiraceae bacterium]